MNFTENRPITTGGTATTRQRIFSGDYSRKMWHAINTAKTVAQLREAVYTVCCRLQELESRIEKSREQERG